MRKETTAGDEVKVWLTDDEIEELRRAAGSRRDDLVIQLGAFVGLRAFEIPQVQPQHVKRSGEDGSHYRLRVPKGKGHQTWRGRATGRISPGRHRA